MKREKINCICAINHVWRTTDNKDGIKLTKIDKTTFISIYIFFLYLLRRFLLTVCASGWLADGETLCACALSPPGGGRGAAAAARGGWQTKAGRSRRRQTELRSWEENRGACGGAAATAATTRSVRFSWCLVNSWRWRHIRSAGRWWRLRSAAPPSSSGWTRTSFTLFIWGWKNVLETSVWDECVDSSGRSVPDRSISCLVYQWISEDCRSLFHKALKKVFKCLLFMFLSSITFNFLLMSLIMYYWFFMYLLPLWCLSVWLWSVIIIISHNYFWSLFSSILFYTSTFCIILFLSVS